LVALDHRRSECVFRKNALRAAWSESTLRHLCHTGCHRTRVSWQEPLTFQQGTCPAGESVSGSGKKLPAHRADDRRRDNLTEAASFLAATT
jgi:hypothetical protein